MEINQDCDPVRAIATSPEAAMKLGSIGVIASQMVNLQTLIERIMSKAEDSTERRGSSIRRYKKIPYDGDYHELEIALGTLQHEQKRWRKETVQQSSPDLLGMPKINKL